MTPEQLKASILQYAIQGKLVEQRPEEGTSEELYRQIQSEKQKLIKEGKIKKEKPLPEISEDEFPFDIPDCWKWVRLGDVCSICTGKKDANFGSDSGEYSFFTCAKEPIRCNSFSFSGESILMAGNGDIGNISYYFGEFEAYQRTYVLQPYIEFSYLKYILYHLQYNWVSYNKDKMFGTAIPYIRLGNVQNYLIAFPPLAEQKRIVAKIEELLPYVDRYAAAYEKLEQFNAKFPEDMKKSILQYAIQGKLVEQRPEEGTGEELYKQIQAEKQRLIKEKKIKKEKPLAEITEDEIPFDIPDSWKWVKLGDCTGYAQTKEKVSPKDITGDMWSLDLEDIQKDTGAILVKTKASERKISGDKVKFHKGQVLYSKLRPYLKKILVAPDEGICTPELVPFDTYLIDENYIAYVLRSPHIDYVINSVTYGVKMPRVGTDTMTNLLLPLPPLAEQKRIVAKLEEILPLCERLK